MKELMLVPSERMVYMEKAVAVVQTETPQFSLAVNTNGHTVLVTSLDSAPFEHLSGLMGVYNAFLYEAQLNAIPPSQPEEPANHPNQEAISILQTIRNNDSSSLSEWEKEFLGSVITQLQAKRSLSIKQIAVINRIREKVQKP